ncbi:MAG: glucose 1-dehydrogenase [Acidobacteria bacterium]|nr:glucose 1-dehydrogenase [Acidobacteriota bacterium]
MRLNQKIAIVTGGGAGMGQAVGEHFARNGARVVIAEIDAARGEAAVAAIRTNGGESIFVQSDISKTRDVKAIVSAAIECYGGVDVLYNNAAVQLIGQDGRAHEVSEEAWDLTHSVNLRGLWLCSKYTIPVMLKRGGGSIIHAASPTGLKACPGYSAYSASKGGVIALTRTMAVDYARDRIRVNAIVPGVTDTPLISQLTADETTRAQLIARTPLGRIGLPSDVVGLAVFLASDESSFCTGGLYMVDGGFTAT